MARPIEADSLGRVGPPSTSPRVRVHRYVTASSGEHRGPAGPWALDVVVRPVVTAKTGARLGLLAAAALGLLAWGVSAGAWLAASAGVALGSVTVFLGARLVLPRRLRLDRAVAQIGLRRWDVGRLSRFRIEEAPGFEHLNVIADFDDGGDPMSDGIPTVALGIQMTRDDAEALLSMVRAVLRGE